MILVTMKYNFGCEATYLDDQHYKGQFDNFALVFEW